MKEHGPVVLVQKFNDADHAKHLRNKLLRYEPSIYLIKKNAEAWFEETADERFNVIKDMCRIAEDPDYEVPTTGEYICMWCEKCEDERPGKHLFCSQCGADLTPARVQFPEHTVHKLMDTDKSVTGY